jgi:multicomponent Na+:H+ antiporter subunit F
MAATLTVLLAVLVASAVAVVVWVPRARTLAGRAVAFDVLASVMTCGLLVGAAITGEGLFLELAVVLGLLGFLTAVTVARFIERTGE